MIPLIKSREILDTNTNTMTIVKKTNKTTYLLMQIALIKSGEM